MPLKIKIKFFKIIVVVIIILSILATDSMYQFVLLYLEKKVLILDFHPVS